MKKIIMRILIIIAVCALCLAYVRHHTIVSAELVEDNGDTYIISFDGELHIYER